MRKSLFPLFLSLIINLLINIASATEFHGELGSSFTSKTDEAILFNFSDDLLSATENCQPYSEDLTTTNPDLKKEADEMFSNAGFEFLIDIKGLSDNLCKFDVTQKMMGRRIIHHCSVNENELTEIVAAMRDRSKELITETFTTYITSKDEDGNIISKTPVKNTITNTRFNIILSKILNNNCQIEMQEPTKHELENIKNEFVSLSESFIHSLRECEPDKETKASMFFDITAEIIGKEKNLCIVKYGDFDLRIPEDKINQIISLDDLNELLTNKNIAIYSKKDTFDTGDLLDIIDNCSPQTLGSSKSIGDVEIEKKRTIKNQNKLCTITFENSIIRGADTDKYEFTCTLSEEYREKLKNQYKDMILKNNQYKQSFLQRSAENRLNLQGGILKANDNILKTIKKDGLCQ